MFEKINCTKIIQDHFTTLYNANSSDRRLNWFDIILFFGISLLVGVAGFFCSGMTINDTARSAIVTAISILIGLFLNLLVLLIGTGEYLIKRTNNSRIRNSALLEQLFKNISFSTLLAIATLIPLILAYFITPRETLGKFANGITWFCLSLLFLTLLMVLKRTHVLIGKLFPADVSHDEI